MKTILSLSLLIGFSFSAFSQTPVFNHIYENETHGFTSIVESDTGFFAINTAEFKVYALDQSGNITNVKEYQDTSYLGESYNTWSSSLFTIAGPEGNCYLQASGYSKKLADTVWSAAFHLVKFDADFDTLWTRKILYTDSITPASYLWPGGFNDCIVDSDGNIYATGEGYTGLNGGSYFNRPQLFFFKADSLGNPLEMKYYYQLYMNNLNNPGKRILETFDNQILIGGNKMYYYQVQTYLDAKAFIIKTDKEGNVIWEKSVVGSVLFDVVQTRDSGIVYAGVNGSSNNEYNYGQAQIVKLKSTGEIDWMKNIHKSHSCADQIIEMQDGSFLVTIREGQASEMSLYLCKLNAKGDILWKKNLNQGVPAFNLIDYDLKEISDHGVVVSGYYLSGVAHPFLIKTDSLGCDGMFSCTDTATVMYLESWADSVCEGDSVLMSIAIANGHAPYLAVVDGLDTIAEPLHLMADSSSYFYYAHPSLANPEVVVTLTDQYGNSFSGSLVLPVVDCGIGVNESTRSMSFEIFPNPTSDKIHLEICQDNQLELRVELLNVRGEILKTFYPQSSDEYLDVSGLTGGIYFVRLLTDSGMGIQKFVKL